MFGTQNWGLARGLCSIDRVPIWRDQATDDTAVHQDYYVTCRIIMECTPTSSLKIKVTPLTASSNLSR